MRTTEYPYLLADGRVWDNPVRTRQVKQGDTTRAVKICLHGRLAAHPCALCEYEFEVLSRKEANKPWAES